MKMRDLKKGLMDGFVLEKKIVWIYFADLSFCIDTMLFFALHLCCMSHILRLFDYCVDDLFWVTVELLSPALRVGCFLVIFPISLSKKVIMLIVRLAIGRTSIFDGNRSVFYLSKYSVYQSKLAIL